jgi:hypothetical protein
MPFNPAHDRHDTRIKSFFINIETGFINICFNGFDHLLARFCILIRGQTITAKQKQAQTGIEKKKKPLGKEMNHNFLPSSPF